MFHCALPSLPWLSFQDHLEYLEQVMLQRLMLFSLCLFAARNRCKYNSAPRPPWGDECVWRVSMTILTITNTLPPSEASPISSTEPSVPKSPHAHHSCPPKRLDGPNPIVVLTADMLNNLARANVGSLASPKVPFSAARLQPASRTRENQADATK